MRVSQNQEQRLGGPNNKASSIWGSILGSPYSGKPMCVYIYIYTHICQRIGLYRA